MADVNSNIGINFDTTAALASLRKLQAGLSTFNQSLTQGNVAAMNAQKGLNQSLIQSINATGKFVASQKEIATSTGSFTQALEKNQLSMRQYFRYTAAAATANTKVFKGMFAQEREIINRARKDRVKLLQSQYIQLGNANGDLVKVLQVVPKHLQMANGKYTDYATRVQMAAQRQQFLNQLLKQGSTNLLNFGKNTQWAGRQLMVGLTIPLSILGSAAAKTFLEMEQAVLKFQRVYGDLTTSGDATNKALKDIQMLGKEFTKYGIAVKDTVEMAATAAAMGLTGGALNAQVIAATRLAVLGQVEQQQALETTISLQNAFGISSEQLAQKINFLNAVENQTVLSIEDLTIAVPKAGPVIKQLGGSVEDLAFFMTAMKEGGINASEGANALKSGLASMINPSKKSAEFLAQLGINIKGIVNNNAGDLKGTVVGFARALDTLDPLNRARAIEQLFGKFQFARLSTLFQNVTQDSSQAARALGLAGASVEELAILSERELAKVEDSTGAKFKKAMENIKNELVPVGKAFLEAVTPIVSSVGKILEKFNGLSDGTKKVITIMIGVIGGLAPIALMTFGILMNGVANAIKLFAKLRGGIAQLNGQNNVLGGGFDYLTNQQTELLAETNALHTSHQQLLSTFNVEKTAVDALALAYGNAASQARALASSSPGLFNSVPGPAGAVAGLPPKKFATGGVVPGRGNGDTVPAMLTPGEVVLTKEEAKNNPTLIAAIQNGSVMKYNGGTGKSQTAGQSSKGVAFDVGGQQLRLAIKPESEKNVTAVTNLVKAMQDGSMGVENGADVLQEVFARLAKEGKVKLETFLAELRIVTEEMSGVTLASNQINEASGFTGKDKIAGHSAGESEGGGSSVRDDMYAAGRGAEYERMQKIANESGDRIDQVPGMKPLQRPDADPSKGKKGNVQLDRGHIASPGATAKSVSEGWDPDLWDISTHSENELSEMLAPKQNEDGTEKANAARDLYFKKLEALEAKKEATTEQINSIKEKILVNGALNEEELQIQARVLQSMLDDTEFMAKETTGKKGNKGTVATPGFKRAATATIFDAEGRAKYPKTDIADPRSKEERVASGMAKVEKRKGKFNEDGGDSFVPLSEAEKKARLDSITVAKDVDADLTAAEKKAETASPSRRTKRLGKDIADGLAQGIEEGTPGVKTKSSQLTDAALPSAAETQARVGKMDLGNKAFYDDINTPEMRDERQVLKSLDRQRRKRGAKGSVELPADKSSVKSKVRLAKKTQVQSQEIAKETENVAKSTVLVAEETDEFANVTQAAVDAQTTNTSNLITTNQLTDAANNNLGQMLPAMDKAGVAQQDLADSSANIAKTNDQIDAEKKEQLAQLKSYNAQEAARMAAENGIVPPGSQTGNEELGKNRMGSVAAYEEASTYTRDKNGKILFDPERDANGKKQPTTLSAKQIKQKKRGMRREKVGRTSGKVSGGLGTAAMVAGMAGAPPAVTAALGGAATVAQFAPMLAGLTGPQGIAAAVVAVGASLYLLNRHFTASARAQAKFVKDITATTDKMKKIGEFTGTVGASEIMAKRAEAGFSGGYIPRERKGQEFGITFSEGEVGKQMAASFVTSMEKFGSKEAAKIFGLELAAYVADGVLTAEQAQGIAFAIGSKFKDQNIMVDIEAQLSNVIGMNGEDLSRDPLELRLRLVSEGNRQVQREIDAMMDKADNTTVSGADEAARVAGFQLNAITLAQLAADSMAKYYEDEKKVLETQLAATANKEEQVKIQTKLSNLIQESSDSQQIVNDQMLQQINSAIAQFDSKIRTNNVGMFSDKARRENAYFDSLKQSVTSAYAGTGMEKDAQTLISRTSKISDTAYRQGFDNTGGKTAYDKGQNLEVKINMLVANKLISPMQANAFLDLFEGNLPDLETTLDVGIQSRGAAKTSELLGIMTRFEDKDSARKMAMNITMEDNETFDRLTNILGLANMLDGKEIDIDIMFGGVEGESRLKVLDEQFLALTNNVDALADKEITTDFLVNFDQNYGTDVSKADLDFIKKEFAGDKKGQVNALRTYEIISQYVNSMEFDSPEAEEMFKQEAERRLVEGYRTRADKSQTFDEYRNVNYALLLDEAKSDFLLDKDGFIQTRFKAVIGTTPKINANDGGNGPGDGGKEKKDPLEFLDSLAMRIKNVRDGAFDATKPLQSMLAAFSNPKVKKDMATAFKVFDGLQQRMIGMKVPKEFRDMIASMSSEDFKELANLKGNKAIFKFKKDKNGKALPRTKANIEALTDTGKKMMKTYNEAIVGEGNVVNREVVEQISNQEKAFKILISEGATATEALEHVQDAALAAAIASGALGKEGSAERKQYIADLKKAADETERFALRQKMITANEEFKLLEQMPKLGSAMKLAGFSADQMQEVLNDPALAKSLIEDLKDGKVDSKEIADYLNSIEARKIIDIQVNYNSGKFSESAQPGMDLVDEMFSVQESMLRTGADPKTNGMVKTLQANEEKLIDLELAAKPIRKEIELLNREIRNIEQEIEKNYTRPIEGLQEEISDLERTLEIDPKFGDRAMEAINKQNAKMSNDAAIMANQAETINDKYDKQAEALAKVAEINEDILNQQKSQLDIAGALTSGDISAAAKAAQEARAQSAQRFSGSLSQALDQSRANEIDGLRGAETGFSQKEIDQKQFENAQALYKMENDPARLKIVSDIRDKQDQIYKLEELREKKLADIQIKQDLILKKQIEQLQPLEDQIADITYSNELIQAQIDKYVKGIEVLGKTQSEWDAVKAKIDANTLAGKNFDAQLGALLASTDAIDKKWQSILDKLAAYNGIPQGVIDAKTQVEQNGASADAQVAADKAAADAVIIAALDKAITGKDDGSPTASANAVVSSTVPTPVKAPVKTAVTVKSGDTLSSIAKANKTTVAALQAANPVLMSNPKYNDGKTIFSGTKITIPAPKAPSVGGGGGSSSMMFKSKGGLIPRYFARGGFARGTDTVPAMLTPGEFIVSKYGVDSYGADNLKKINNGDAPVGAVYNNTYTLTVNAKTNANPNEIAQAVMSTIRQVDDRRIRGVSLNGR